MPRHPKVIKLRRKLGAEAVLSWITLIAFCAQFRTTGSLAGMDNEEIAIAAEWSGDPLLFVKTLVEIRLLDESSGGTLSFHDWLEHQPFVATFELRSERAKRASAARWAGERNDANTENDPARMQHGMPDASASDSEPQSESDTGADAPSNATGNAIGNATGNAPSPSPSPLLSTSVTDTKPSPKTLLPPSSAVTAASPEEEFKDSPWLISFLKEQTTFNGHLLPKLIHHDFWADVSDACNGIDANFLREAFAKMAIWLRENPRRAPTPVGVRRFVAGWLQRAAEKRRKAA